MADLETVLIIDDDLNIINLVRKFILNEGKRALLASSSNEGLEYLKTDSVDVMFIDLKLPDDDGISLLHKALNLCPNIASVIMTGFGTLESAINAMRLGACDYITKPFNQQQIIYSLQRALSISQANKQLEQKNACEKNELPLENFVAASISMQKVLSLIKKISLFEVPIMLEGEVGVGKKTLARLIHQKSQDDNEPFSHINCSTAVSSELNHKFGNVVLKTLIQKRSLKNIQKGTIYLEDIEQLPSIEQKQLVRMIEDGCIRTPWSTHSNNYSFRLIASTTVELKEEVSKGNFHRSLYDYLNFMPIKVPPLRERRDGIKPLGIHLLEQLSYAWNRNLDEYRHRINNDVWESLINYDWPGNVQELATMLSRIVLLGESSVITNELKQLQHPISTQNNDLISVPLNGDLKSIEQQIIKEVVKRCGGNKAAAARTLRMQRKTLYRILDDRNNFRGSD
ncbi:Transcriptional regulatory protein ZraR [Gimesia alba]|uniref:Transcriptional regulatory protein ZraR n=1 Tax=Gimesia alba TaxID=2527973 RepID=A0A517RMU3_9PLAN|nr:sigma-54 dependent transcriptional regulator [Gimesia alba]QDT45207.1 Transcriptional regulatory protein ZraR [Gimesia alba]